MDSLDAVLRWNAKRDAVFQKMEKHNARKVVMPERAKVKIRLRPGDVTREEFGSWMGALAPEAGAVNEFRTKMYQSDLRGLQNRIKVNQPDARTQRIVTHATFPADPPKFPGIQLFFQNTIDNSPLPGLRGGALTQLPPTAREYRRVEETVRKNLRSQMRDLTAMRASQPLPSAPREVLTALDEAKLQIGTSVETIAQQLLRGIFTTDILRELTSASTAIARNAPLMDAGALGELYRYVADLVSALRANAKNTGKEIAEENLISFDDDAQGDFDLYGLPAAPAAQPRDLDKGVKSSQKVAEAIYARVEALFEFLKRQFAVAERPMAERIQSARASLSMLGTNIDRKTYPADVRKRLNLEEQQKAEQEAIAAAPQGDLLGLTEAAPAALPSLDIGELAGIAPGPSAMMPAPAEGIPDVFESSMTVGDMINAADVAREEGRRADEWRFAREAYRTLQAFGRDSDADQLADLAADNGIDVTMEVPEQLIAEQAAAMAAPASAAAAEEEAPAAEEEEAPAASASSAASAAAPAGAIVLDADDLQAFREQFASDAGVAVEDLTRNTAVPRNAPIITALNDYLKAEGSPRRFNSGVGEIKLSAVYKKLREANVYVFDASGVAKPISL
jgi:hypothetical protein